MLLQKTESKGKLNDASIVAAAISEKAYHGTKRHRTEKIKPIAL